MADNARCQEGRVAVVTGGGGGIGTAVALELARHGAMVVALDNGVGVEGEALEELTAAETVRQIEAAGGRARASTISVTGAEDVRSLFGELRSEFGSLDVVVNTAGVLRYPRYPLSSYEDWRLVLDVHLNGYLNVLEAALPIMDAAGYGRIVGFTSGAGLARTSVDGLAYGCAKRAVASVTWELRGLLPDGVSVNAMSPIAATRMVKGALVAMGLAAESGLDLSAMPQAEDMAPATAMLASAEFGGWCNGHVVYSAGSELSLIARPRLLEAVRTGDVADFASALDTLVPVVLARAEAEQRTSGGSNPRFGPVFDKPGAARVAHRASGGKPGEGDAHRPVCVVVTADSHLAQSITSALQPWELATVGVGSWQPFDRGAHDIPNDFETASETIQRAAAHSQSPIAAIVVALGQPKAFPDTGPAWQRVIDDHRVTAPHIIAHAVWLKAAADYAAHANAPVRVVFVTSALSAAGRTSAQAVTQMARSANDTPSDVAIDVFAIGIESAEPTDNAALGQVVARLAVAQDTTALRGAELVMQRGWLGIRSHPGPIATVSYGGPAIPDWVGDTLRDALRL
jgi:NAD(P)-dependent dehydrogenase (short-subunit alcohol dehydrogenase family)